MKKTMMLAGLILIMATTPAFAELGMTHYMDGLPTAEASLNWNHDIQAVMLNSDGTKRFFNHSQGYSFDIPADYVIDTTMADAQTVLSNSNTRIEVYYDDLNGTSANVNSYVNYNMGFQKGTRHKMEMNYWTTVNGVRVHVNTWTRSKLSRLPDDKNHYFVAEFVKNTKEVVTIFIKSQEPIGVHDRVLHSFRFIDKVGTPGNHRVFSGNVSRLSESVKPYYKAAFSKESPQRWGIFSQGATLNMDYLKGLEKDLNYQFDVLVRYQTLDNNAPVEELQRAWDNNRVVELTMQTMSKGADNGAITYDILDGKYDVYLKQYARDLKRFGKPVLFRLNNEMNGDWCTYSAYHYSRDPELYKEMWRYVHGLFKAEGADNLLWVWNPHDNSFPNFKWNSAFNYFPGEEMVDIVGLTGYNAGTYHPGEKWRSFDEIYPNLYSSYVKTYNYPMMITEFGSNSVGGDKAAWVQDMFAKIPTYDRIKIIIWFNGTDLDAQGKPARIYRLDTGDAVQKAFEENLKRFGGLTLPTTQTIGIGEKETSWKKQ